MSSETPKPTFTCSMLTIETLEQGVKCLKLTIKTPEQRIHDPVKNPKLIFFENS